jgi:hypothetical protein
MTAEMRRELERSAARRKRSLNQEILDRINVTFAAERSEHFDGAARAFGYLFSETARTVGRNMRREWWRDPFSFHAVRKAFDRILEGFAPQGEERPPEPRPREHSFAHMEMWGSPSGRGFLLDKANLGKMTADEVASTISDLVLTDLELGAHGPQDTSGYTYGMSNARNDLQIEQERGGQ